MALILDWCVQYILNKLKKYLRCLFTTVMSIAWNRKRIFRFNCNGRNKMYTYTFSSIFLKSFVFPEKTERLRSKKIKHSCVRFRSLSALFRALSIYRFRKKCCTLTTKFLYHRFPVFLSSRKVFKIWKMIVCIPGGNVLRKRKRILMAENLL